MREKWRVAVAISLGVTALKVSADQGDWKAEAELATVLARSADLFRKLKALAVLNRNP